MSIRWGLLDELTWLRESLGPIADDFLGRRSRLARPRWVPAVEIFETAAELVVRAWIPRIDPKSLRIDVSADTLSIKGESRMDRDQHGRCYHCQELHHGALRRVMTLPTSVDPDQASATYTNGIVEIRMPKAPRVKAHSVKVEVEQPRDERT